jgi:hypothetical protein
MFKDDFHLTPAKLGFFTGIIALPWVLKPFWGIAADSFPIFGSKRKAYLFIFGILCGSGWLYLSFKGYEQIEYAIILLFMISLSVCFCNVVGEALMVELAGSKYNSDS